MDNDCSQSKMRNSLWMCNDPQNMKEVRLLHLEDKHAIIPNLPHPQENDFYLYSCVNIEEIVKTLFVLLW